MNGLIGRKVGMTSIFDETGKNISCTVVEATPNVVTSVKTAETDGYFALQLAAFDVKEKSVTAPLKGHFAKASTTPKKKLIEFRDCSLSKGLGDTVTLTDVFNEGDKIRVVGNSKGKGFQGVVKRHGFGGVGQSTHGQHNRGRAPGSIGAGSDPSRVMKGMRMGGRMGNDQVTVRNLMVVKILPEKNIVLIKGALPGHIGSFVILQK